MSGDLSELTGNPADAVVDALLRASRALVDITARSLSSVNGEVTLPQFRTLVVLSSNGPQTVSALADQLAVHASTMTRMCNRLVSRGLVARQPSVVDRREVVIALSTTGSTLVSEVTRARRVEIDDVVERLDPNDRNAAVRALETFAHAAGDNPARFDADQLAARVPSLDAPSHLED